MYDPSGNYSALFSLEPDVSLDFVSGNNQDSRENKPNCFPRDHSLSVYCNVLELDFVTQSLSNQNTILIDI